MESLRAEVPIGQLVVSQKEKKTGETPTRRRRRVLVDLRERGVCPKFPIERRRNGWRHPIGVSRRRILSDSDEKPGKASTHACPCGFRLDVSVQDSSGKRE